MTHIKTFAEFDAAIIYYDKNLDCLFLKYTGPIKNHEEFVEINFNVLSAFKKLNTYKFVADIRKIGFVGPESQIWVAEVLLPGIITHLKGVKLYHAQLLDPSEIMSKISGTEVKLKAKNITEGFEVEQFTSEDVLKNKLLSMKNSFV